jgi:hypothetical protein
VEEAHQLRVRQTFETSGCVDTLNPQGAEVALLVATVAEGVSQTLFPGVLGYGPYVATGTEVTSSKVENLFASVTRRYVVYRSWHSTKIVLNAAFAAPRGGQILRCGCSVNNSLKKLVVWSYSRRQRLLQAEEFAHVGLVGTIEDGELRQVALLLLSLLRQDVALVSMFSLDFT